MKQTYYANIYPPFAGSCGHVYATRQLADQMAARDRIACVPFTCDLLTETEALDAFLDEQGKPAP